MDEITLKFPATVYARLREMVLAGAKYPATGEAGLHSGSQLLLMMDQQVEEQRTTSEKSKTNGRDKEDEKPACVASTSALS